MMLSNFRVHADYLIILLVFCYFVGQAATADTNSLPESVVELLSGKTTDFTGVANQIPEHQLPTALAAAKLLKFHALHSETSLSSNEAEAFETILLDRMSAARQVAFSQNETACKIGTDDTPQLLSTNAEDQTLTVLNGAYEVDILKVEWTENANSSKQIVEASTYNFVATTPGITKGAAIVDLAVAEIMGDQKREVKAYEFG